MIKLAKVKFASEKLLKEFNSLKDNDPIKKQLIRAIHKLGENAYSGIQIAKSQIQSFMSKNME
jgi:uncharacterized protein YneF (UPF0154 family)